MFCLNSIAAPQDSLLAARKFASDAVLYYDCAGDFDIGLEVGGDREDYLKFRYVPGIGITRLSINGVDIVKESDDPVMALPWPTEGTLEDVWVYARGMNAQGEEVHTGYADLDNPKPGDSIYIELNAGWQEVFIDYTVPVGVDPSTLGMRVGSSSVREYSSSENGFWVWYDVTAPAPQFEIVSNGSVIDFGSLDYRGRIVESNEDLLVNIKMPVGLEHVDITDYRHHQLNGLTMDGHTYSEEGEYVSSKVIWVTKDMKWESVPFQVTDVLEFDLEAWAMDENGDLVLISENIHYKSEWYGTYLEIMTGQYEDVFLVFKNVVTKGLTFNVSFGGGKG
jgi:hypothetical protein